MLTYLVLLFLIGFIEVILDTVNQKIMFSKSELDYFNNPKGMTQKWLNLLLRFEDHKQACAKLGVVGAGCYRHYKID